MPHYVKDGASQKPFAKRWKNFKTHERAAQFLATLEPHQFKHLQLVASHFEGHVNKFSKRLPKHNDHKVKPSSYQFLVKSKHPHEVTMGLAAEQAAHNHHAVESHMGGGLLDGINAIASWLWNFTTMPAVDWVKDKVGYSESKRKMTAMNHYDADTLEEAYKNDGKRDDTMRNGWQRVDKYDTDYTTVYRDPHTNSLHVAIRGSKTATDWLYHDVLLLARNRPGEEETEELQQFLLRVAKENPKTDITLNSHSLSGAFVQTAFTTATVKQQKVLASYDTINMFNPGGNALVNMANIRKFVKDRRVHLFLNKSDIISQAYAQAVTDNNKDRVIWGNATYYPIGAHTYRQWQEDSPKNPDALGQHNPKSDYDNVWLRIAKDISARPNA